MTYISLRIDEELKKAIKGYAYLKGTTVSDVVLSAIKEKLEDKSDYELAMLAYESLDYDNLKDFSDLCSEVGINYNEL